MVDVTLLKLDLSDATFNAPFGGDGGSGAGARDGETGDGFDEEASRARGVAALVGLAFLVAGALLVRRVIADDADGDGAVAPDESATVELEA